MRHASRIGVVALRLLAGSARGRGHVHGHQHQRFGSRIVAAGDPRRQRRRRRRHDRCSTSPAAGVHTIAPLTALPSRSRTPSTIDGYHAARLEPRTRTGPACRTTPCTGSRSTARTRAAATDRRLSASQGAFAFVVRGLVINRAPAAAIQVSSATTATVEGCFLGLDPTGLTALPNTYGVYVEVGVESFRSGASLPAQRNVISGNVTQNIGFGCLVRQRRLGPHHPGQLPRSGRDRTRPGRSTRRPATRPASRSASACTNVTIGGPTAASRNVISGNGIPGVGISNSFCGTCVTGIVVQGNYIGTDVTGTLPLGNGDPRASASTRPATTSSTT